MPKYEIYLNAVYSYMIKKYGIDVTEREMYPLSWYISTGRASSIFLNSLYKAKPFMIGRLLHNNGNAGSHDEAVRRVVEYVNKLNV